MMQHDNTTLSPASRRVRGSDVLVLLGMMLVSVATAAGLHIQRGVVLGPAALSAFALFSVFVASHFLFGRGASTRSAARHRSVRAPAARARDVTERTNPVSASPVDGFEPPALPITVAPAPASERSGECDGLPGYWNYAPGMPTLDMPPPIVAEAAMPALAVTKTRISDPALPAMPPPLQPQHSETEQTTLKEVDVEVIQRLIKKLADEVNAAEASQTIGGQSSDSASTIAIEPPNPMAPEQSVEASLSALRVAAETMRAAQALRATEPPAPGNHEASDAGASVLEAASVRSRFTGESVSMPPPVGREHARMAAIAEAISAGRLEVLLQPILGLGNQRSGHFEVTFRLRASNGELIELDDEAELQRTGLLPLFDAAKIARASNIALRLSERRKTGSLFSGQNRESVTDDTYLAEIAAAIRTRPIGAGQLVMTFSQADVRVFEAPEWNALADLNALGFRFALSGLTDLDMDFDALTKAGFGFAKLEADMFLEGLRAPEGLIPASDLCFHLANRGLALVVEKIDDQNKLARIFGFGVLFGQGQLFGAPRPVKAEAATSPRTAAA